MKTQSMFVVTVSAGFEPEAKRELEKLLSRAEVRSLFFKGNLLVECSEDEGEAVGKLREASTQHVGHVFPVDIKVRISSRKESTKRLCEQVVLLGKLKKGETFLVQCKRRGSHGFSSQDVERELGSYLEEATGAIPDLEDPEKIVIVQIFQNFAFLGVTEAENLLAKRISVSRKYARGERPFTRAEHKIKEAIKAFDIRIDSGSEVLDLGAAPGGWTRVLSGVAKRVVAVDPANLDASIVGLPNVIHLQCRAEEIPDEVGQFDLIVNDMNLSPIESASTMVNLADRLRKNGAAVMTVKFVTRARKKHVSEAIDILKTRYGNFRVEKLPHNRFETTLFMEKV